MTAIAATSSRILAPGRDRIPDPVARAVKLTLRDSARQPAQRTAWNWIALGYLGAALGTAALLSPVQSQAQEAAAGAEELTEIMVTGTRIARDGFEAPTPVSVLGLEEIQAAGVASINDFVNQLPSVLGSQSASTNAGSLSSGQAGIAALNLRQLGANRTLILLDGQRSVSSAATGLVDVNTFPQALVQRVEVVTGGASAAYGSDAVGGVVNMILDREYTGIKTDYEFGVTGYDDLANHKFTLTAGLPFAGGRGHLLMNGEFFTQDGQQSIDRDWNNRGYFMIDNPSYVVTNGVGNGQPSRYVGPEIGPSQQAPGGVITGTPNAAATAALRGTYFGTINPATGTASTGQLVFGHVSGPWMRGGDWQYTGEEHTGSNSLSGDEERTGLFTRASFDVTDSFSVFAQLSYNEFQGLSYYQQTPNQANVTIQRDNAYLPAALRTQMTTLGITSFTMGTSNAGIPAAGSDMVRSVERYVVGADGDFGLLGRDWSWDIYYQMGLAKTDEELVNTWNNANMAFAQDAVFHPTTGQIVCRSSIANPANGCVPINRIGIGGVTDAALDYIFPRNPLREQELQQDVAALTFSTPSAFDIWAGPVSLAFGAEWRKEEISGVVDPYFEAGWLYGNFKVTKGDYSVKEAFVETVVPIISGLEFNGAFRATDYSVSGSVETWKAGLSYRPIEDVLLRYTTSRDIRAPNLSELFAAGTARTNSVNVPEGGAIRADQFTENTTGSLSLVPEAADSWGFGVVLTPRFLPGFAFSADYFDIDITDAIGTINAQNTVNLCYEQGKQDLCANLIYASGGPGVAGSDITQINIIPINFATQRTRGIDLETSYRFSAGPGDMVVRALATRYIENLTNNGVDAPTDDAGTNDGGGTPDWVYRLSTTYNLDPVSFTVTGRGFSDGVYSNEWIECTSNCPTATAAVRTINDNDIPGAFYVDASATYSFMMGPTEAEAFFSIKNLMNTDPELVGNGPGGNNTNAYPQTNRTLYDVYGRTFRLGLRMAF